MSHAMANCRGEVMKSQVKKEGGNMFIEIIRRIYNC
jgi:hypothetical protein